MSSRHLSFVETGRSRPSPELLLHLAEHLDVPLRERNGLLLAAGYAPTSPESSLDAPGLAAVRAALDQVLAAHEPFPAIVVDRQWSAHLLDRLRRQVLLTGDEALAALHEELRSLPGVCTTHRPGGEAPPALAVPLRLRTPTGELRFLSTITTFGTALDVTLAELSLEAFLPADAATSDALVRP